MTEHNQQFVEECRKFLKRYYDDEIMALAQRYPSEERSLVIDWYDMFQFSPEFADDFLEKPDSVRGHILEGLKTYDLPVDVGFEQAHIRVTNIDRDRVFDIGEIVPDSIGEAVGVRGQVSQVTAPKPELDEAMFECERCGSSNGPLPQRGDDIQTPYECVGCERQGPFRLVRENSTFTNSQLVRIERPPEQTGGGEAHLDIRLKDDLANIGVRGGERVEVSGTLAIDEEDLEKRTFDYHLEGDDVGIEDGGFEDINPDDHRDIIEEIKASDEPIELLKDSLAPHLSRDEKLDTIMEALVLQMVGSFRKDPEKGPTYRGDSHVLLLGDPGTSKSELLEQVETLAPRSKLKSGEGLSQAGMTAAATKDDFGDTQWSLKAGLMVLASGGIACLDEVDKANEDALNSAHQALENQRVTISRAGIDANLPAQTSLLAAGNPKYGRFDMYEPIAEQIDLSPALMSRFDLMFMMQDDPDPERDSEIADIVIESWAQTGKAETESGTENEDVQRDIPEDAYKAYLAECKNKVQPKLDDESVKSQLKQHYIDIRQSGYDEDAAVPVTARKLEAFLRLAESSARARFSETVEQEDVDRAHRLVYQSLQDVGVDPETGEFDADVVETGTSKTQRDRIRGLKNLISTLCSEFGDEPGAPVAEIIDRVDLEEDTVRDQLSKLRTRGEIYEPQQDYYRVSDE